jgi:hypothetical protein
VQDKKWESFETRFAQTTKLSLSIFCLAQLAVSEVDEGQKQQQNQNNQYRRTFIFLLALQVVAFDFVFDFIFDFDLPPFETM